jgi:hypothetical protein
VSIERDREDAAALRQRAERLLARVRSCPTSELTFRRDDLQTLEEYLRDLRTRIHLAALRQLHLEVAASLGEVLLTEHGGSWTTVEGDPAVRLTDGSIVLVLDWTRLYFAGTAANRLVAAFDAVGAALRSADEAPEGE